MTECQMAVSSIGVSDAATGTERRPTVVSQNGGTTAQAAAVTMKNEDAWVETSCGGAERKYEKNSWPRPW